MMIHRDRGSLTDNDSRADWRRDDSLGSATVTVLLSLYIGPGFAVTMCYITVSRREEKKKFELPFRKQLELASFVFPARLKCHV